MELCAERLCNNVTQKYIIAFIRMDENNCFKFFPFYYKSLYFSLIFLASITVNVYSDFNRQYVEQSPIVQMCYCTVLGYGLALAFFIKTIFLHLHLSLYTCVFIVYTSLGFSREMLTPSSDESAIPVSTAHFLFFSSSYFCLCFCHFPEKPCVSIYSVIHC